MTCVIQTSQNDVEINLDDSIGATIAVSGGIDSATLLYVTAEYIVQNKLDLPLYAYTIPTKFDVACAYHAQLVVDFVQRKFSKVKINHIIKSTIRNGQFKTDQMDKIRKKLFFQNKVDSHLVGITANPKPNSNFYFVPPQGHYVPPENYRNNEMDSIWPSMSGIWLRPFCKIDKKGIREITDQKNITSKLLLITKSCTSKYEYECGRCWWCQERQWAFS